MRGPQQVIARTSGTVGRWAIELERLFGVAPGGAELLHGLHVVRLGGPYLAAPAAGTVLRVTGQHGGHFRVRLAADRCPVSSFTNRYIPKPDNANVERNSRL